MKKRGAPVYRSMRHVCITLIPSRLSPVILRSSDLKSVVNMRVHLIDTVKWGYTPYRENRGTPHIVKTGDTYPTLKFGVQTLPEKWGYTPYRENEGTSPIANMEVSNLP